jgi:hypothetical protein
MMDKSVKKPFQMPNRAYVQHRMRVQFFDGNKYVECVAFDNDIDTLEKLEFGKIYLVENADVRKSPHVYRAWPKRTNNSEFDLSVSSKTRFSLIENGSLIQHACVNINQSDKTDPVTSVVESSKLEKMDTLNEEEEEESSSDDENECESKEVSISSIEEILSLNKADVFLNVMGILLKKFEVVQRTGKYGNVVDMMNIELIDKTEKRINVSIWGKDVKSFNYKIGDCLFFKRAKTVMFKNRICLMKTKNETVLMNVSNCMTEKRVRALIDWYNDYTNFGVKKRKNKGKSLVMNKKTRNDN